MAKTEKRARERTVSSSYFLGCFGLSRKIYSDKAKVAAEVGCEMKKKKKRSRWLLCSKFRSKNREIKPAPIEKTEITTPSVEDETDKKKPVSLISRITTDRTHVLADDKAVNQETKETKPKELRDVTTDRSKPIEPLASSREDTRPERISNMKPSREKTGSRVRKFDPVIGISVIILTLVIMLVWGRLFAILCTSAWCYSLPRLRNVAALVKRSASDGSARLNS
ncbi:PREDICTED: uncharacterized protein At5g23160-like [Brassica oleracea var. oleracea]|uniref:Uncharacterized protein n=1 Tax=Brassica oleracea var. oleracea TaxID=109376 RepID=A0A0D3B094_BRAOL|nr:PREDICTED: uncharacterized protein At5g23160-like [Brassica oleracea var. oleracea]